MSAVGFIFRSRNVFRRSKFISVGGFFFPMKNNVSSNGVSAVDVLEKYLAVARLLKSCPQVDVFSAGRNFFRWLKFFP